MNKENSVQLCNDNGGSSSGICIDGVWFAVDGIDGICGLPERLPVCTQERIHEACLRASQEMNLKIKTFATA